MLMGDTRKVWGDWEKEICDVGKKENDGADDVEEAMEYTILLNY